jgi:hypothetical protein
MCRILMCAAAGALFIGNQAVAQTQQQLVGSWLLTSFEFRRATPTPNYKTHFYI